MPDWNGDGKQDWHDEYVINEVIGNKEADKSRAPQYSTGSMGCSTGMIIAAIIIGIILDVLIHL